MKSKNLIMPLIGIVTVAVIIVSISLPKPENANKNTDEAQGKKYREDNIEKNLSSTQTNSQENTKQGIKAITFNSVDSYYSDYADGIRIILRFNCKSRLIDDSLKIACDSTPEKKFSVSVSSNTLIIDGDFDFSQVYTFKIAKGLKAAFDEILKEDLTIKVKTCDCEPSINFLSEGLYYPFNGKQFELPFAVTNYKKVKAELYRSYDNNLFFDFDSYKYTTANARSRMEQIGEKEISINAVTNVQKNNMLNLEEFFQTKKKTPGVYLVCLTPLERLDEEECYASTVYAPVMLTDFAVNLVADVVNDSGIALYTHRLSTGEPVRNADIIIYSSKNQIAAKGKTDANGLAKLSYDPAWKREDNSASVVKIMTNDEFMFCPFHYEDYNRNLAIPFNHPSAFVFTERGVCRPGEKFTVSSFIRKWENNQYLPLKNAPLTLTVYNPSHQAIKQTILKSDAYGFVSQDIELPLSSMTGTYECEIGLGEQTWGSTKIYINNYTPDRMKIKMGHKEKNKDIFTFADEINYQADVNYYFGPTATGINVTFAAWASEAKFPKHWEGWEVGSAKYNSLDLEKVQKSFKNENSPFAYTMPSLQSLKCVSTVPVRYGCSFSANEPGGRTVTDSDAVTVYPMRHYIGLKTKSEGSNLSITLGLLGIDPAKKELLQSAKKVNVTFQSIDWDYVLEHYGNTYRKEWKKIIKPLPEKSFTITIPKDAEPDIWNFTKKISLPSGHYVVTTQQSDYTDCGITESEVWHYAGETGKRSMDPQQLTFKTDSDTYQPGDTAKLTFRYNGSAKAFYVYGGQTLDGQETKDIKAGENVISVKIPETCSTGSYYTQVFVIGKNGEDYIRSIGFAELKISQEQKHKLTLKVVAPETAKPGEKVNISLTAADFSGKPTGGEALLFAVDSGVLSLTDFKTPNIFNFFYGCRDSVFNYFEMYGDLYPNLKLLPDGTIAGDASLGKLKNTSLKKKATARLVAPPVIIPDNGKITVPVQLPDHTGAMRFMAVASNDTMTGSADCELKMRNQFSISLTAPGAAAIGDEFQISVRLFNNDEKEAAGKLVLTCPGTSEPETIIAVDAVSPDSHKDFSIRKTAVQNGTHMITVKFISDNGSVQENDYLTVRPVFVPQTITKSYIIHPNTKTEITIPNGFDCKDASISVAASPVVYLKDVLSWLNQYPYGCVEQITSRAFPFIVLSDMQKLGLIDDNQLTLYKNRVPDTYTSLLGMLRYNGSFNMWSSGSEAWPEGSVYATHFIFAAKRAKLINPDKKIIDAMLKYQRIQANNAVLNRTLRAYSAYVLALAGDQGAVTPARNILATDKKDFAAFLAGAALIHSGYAAEGAPALSSGLAGDIAGGKGLDALSGFSSYPAKLGMELAILSELGISDSNTEEQMLEIAFELVKELKKDDSAWGTTQANAWGCFGLVAYAKHMSAALAPLNITVDYGNGKSEKTNENLLKFVPQSKTISIKNNGKAPIFAQLVRRGIPEDGDPDADKLTRKQIHLRREYLNAEGKQITSVKSGDLVYVRLHAEVDCRVEHLVIADMIPGGFEIEDEELATRKSATIPAGIKKEFNEFCNMNIQKGDDKFVVYVRDVYQGDKQDIIYKLRAVTPGKFRIPQAEAEAMYQPDIKGLIPASSDGNSSYFTIE